MTAMRNVLNQTPTGRNAMYVYDRDNVQREPRQWRVRQVYSPELPIR